MASDDVGLATSIAAGIGSGVFKIFEGAATLGATLMDLGVDKDRAEAVEQFFADINPFDEAAEATAAGKITELIVNIGIPGGLAFKMGSGLTKAALTAKKAGKYLSGGEKMRRFGQGALAGGAAEAVFVGDVEDAGTFGDWLGGPTEIERDTGEPVQEILNRLKFGLEGTLFTGAIGGAGKTISKLRNQTGTGRVIEGKFNKWADKWLSKPARARGPEVQEGFELRMGMEGAVGADRNAAENAMISMDKLSNKIAKLARNEFGKEIGEQHHKQVLKDMNDVLMSGGSKKGTLQPIFGQVDEFKIDPKTGLPGATDEFKTGKQIYNVTLDGMDSKKVRALRELLEGKYKIDPKAVDDLLDDFTGMRNLWGELFTIMGRRLTPEALEEFEEIIPAVLKDSLDRGYTVFKNNAGDLDIAKNYAPTKAVLLQARRDFQEVAKGKGLNLTDDMADRMVEEVWTNAQLPKGILLSSTPGATRVYGLPQFFKDSVADPLQKNIDKRFNTNLSKLTDGNKEIINKLLGKAKNPMSTLVEGTNALSTQVRFNEYLDNLVKKSNELKVKWDDWDKAGRPGGVAAMPRAPFLVNNSGEARKYFGGTGNDWQRIKGEREMKATAIGKWEDPKELLKPVDEIEAAKRAEQDVIKDILNPVDGKIALNDYAKALTEIKDLPKSMGALLYQNAILYPKATSQMAKTILAPFTHARNFISAAAFAGANGFVPFGNTADVKAAWNALQFGGGKLGTRQLNKFYQDLLRLGVVNSQVQLGDLRRLLEDVDFGGVLNKVGADYNGVNTLLKRLSKIKKGAQDAYTAEDDFWKIFTFLGEKTRLDKAFRTAGLRLGQEFTDMNGVKRLFNDQTMQEMAADLVKNNVPNYARVSEAVKGLRKWPVGNFVAFPAEILRTGTNIVSTGLDEILYTTTINGKKVNPLRARGYQRLAGMAITTTALPLGTVAAMQTIYDVSDDEINAMRRYVADWSKNSTLIPFKDDDGNLEYVDFSHLNAYDTLTRPIQTVINSIEQGRNDKDGIMDDFILGLIESTKELGQPFLSESIWTEALQDVAPVLGRGGQDIEGRRIWNPEDSIGDKMGKAVGHLVESQAPLNWKQLQRLGLSALPMDWEGRFDERGNEYELGNEMMGIAGLRKVKVQPEKSFNYKITDYKKGIRNSRNLFTAATLKGGVVTPSDVVEAYINSNRALYQVNREMYQDMEAAKTLGMNPEAIDYRMEKRGERQAYNALNEGRFRPLKVSRDVRDLFALRAQELGVMNPFEAAQDVLDRIADVLEMTSLSGDFFPDLDNPFAELPLVGAITGAIDNMNLGAQTVGATTANNLNTGYGKVNTPMSPVDQYAALFPRDELGKGAAASLAAKKPTILGQP